MGGLNESGTVFEIEDQDIVSPQIMSWLLIRKSGDSSGPPFDKDGRPCPVSMSTRTALRLGIMAPYDQKKSEGGIAL